MRQTLLKILPALIFTALFCFSLPAWGLDAATITVEGRPDFMSGVIAFLCNDVVRTVLLTVGIAGVVIEIATVGSFGVFGAAGVIAFVLYFLGNIWAGSMGLNAVLFLIGGIILVLLEIFVIPGFGVAGVCGVLAVLTSLVLASPDPGTAVWSVLIALAVAVGIIWFTLKNKKTRRVWRKLILAERTANDSGYIAPDPSLSRYLKMRGTSLTILRPAGTALINGDHLDVVTRGEFVEAGRPVEVILIEGSRVVVREAQDRPEQ